MKKPVSIIALLTVTHFLAWWLGSAWQVREQGVNSHAHLSDVSDAIRLGEYFASTDNTSDDPTLPAKATTAIIFRILTASEPDPNSKDRLEKLETALRTKYF